MRRIVLYGILIFQIILIISLVRGIQLSRRSSVRIESLEATKEKLVAEQEKLKMEEQYVKSDFYVEKVAREELHLSKPGETVVIIPDNLIIGEDTDKQQEKKEEKTNWQKWFEVLSGKI